MPPNVPHGYMPDYVVQRAAKQLLAKSYQFYCLIIPIYRAVVLCGVQLEVTWELDCGRGLDTELVALVKQKA